MLSDNPQRRAGRVKNRLDRSGHRRCYLPGQRLRRVRATLIDGRHRRRLSASGLSGSKWVGYPTSAANFLTTTGPTGATPDTLTLTNQVGVDYSVPAGAYSDTITYVATPTY